MKKGKLPRREREKILHRREILEAALELFSQKGFHDVSIKEIAERAEFAVGTIYKFFKSKQHLYKSLILETTMQFHTTLLKVLDAENGNYLEHIEQFIKTKMGLLGKNISIIRLYLAEIHCLSPALKVGLDAELAQMQSEYRTQLARFLQNAMEQGYIRKHNPMNLAMALDGLIKGFVFGYLEEIHSKGVDSMDQKALEDLFAEKYANVVLDIFFRGVAYSDNSPEENT